MKIIFGCELGKRKKEMMRRGGKKKKERIEVETEK